MSAIDNIISRLDKVRKSSKGYSARCPAHEDRTASLAIMDGDSGKVLIHCFAGCSPSSVLSSIGLQLSDLFEDNRSEFNALKKQDRDLMLLSAVRRTPGFAYDLEVLQLGLASIKQRTKMNEKDIDAFLESVHRLSNFINLFMEYKHDPRKFF